VETFDNIAETYKRLRRLQDHRIFFQNQLRNRFALTRTGAQVQELKDEIIGEVK